MKQKQPFNSWMDKITWVELPALFDAALDFLRSQYGFQPTDRHIGDTLFGRYYLRQHVGIQVCLDRRDHCLDSYLLRLSGGQIPEGGNVDPTGHRFRLSMFEARRVRRIPTQAIPTPLDAAPAERLAVQLQSIAAAVRQFSDILSDSDSIVLEFDRPKDPKQRKLP